MFTNYVGFKCPRCNSKVGVGIGIGEPTCPSCGTLMVADDAPISNVYANVTCKKCGTSYGMVIGNTCQCGEPFE